MNHLVSRIRNIRTIKALRGDELLIDLGRTYTGELKSWMKREPNSPYYRVFEIVDNRFLKLPKSKAIDYVEDGVIVEKIAGKWYFDVEQTNPDGSSKTIVTGKIFFVDDITCSNGTELFPTIVPSIFNSQFNNIFS